MKKKVIEIGWVKKKQVREERVYISIKIILDFLVS